MSALRMFDVVVLVLAVLRLIQLVEYSPSFQFWPSKVVKSQVDTIAPNGNTSSKESSRSSKSQVDTISWVFSIISILVLEGVQIPG